MTYLNVSTAQLQRGLFTDIFAAPDITQAASQAGDVTMCAITPNLPANAVIKRATLHLCLGAFNNWQPGSLKFNGTTIYNVGYVLGPGSQHGYTIVSVDLDPATVTINKSTLNQIVWNGSAVGQGSIMMSAWLELAYYIDGGIADQLRLSRDGKWIHSNGFSYISLTEAAAGDQFVWNPTIAVPAGMTLRNAFVISTMQVYANGNGGTESHMNAGRMYFGGTPVGAGFGTFPQGYLWLAGAGEVHMTGTLRMAYDLKALLTGPGAITLKWTGLSCSVNLSAYQINNQYSLWVSWAPQADA